MSHEIRTPINGIKGLHYLIQQESDVGKIHRHVEQAESALSVLLKVLNDVLDFSKIEADKLILQQEAVDITSMCEDVMQMISMEAKEKNLNVNLDIDSSVPKTFFTDPIRLKQVLLNLLNNAVKFTEQGGVSLVVSFEQDRLKFSVIDTGIGISESARKQLFQPFSQADGSTSRRFGGTGLGLSICAELVGLMGGTIAFESTEFKGSQFDVYLPLTCNLPHKAPLTQAPKANAEHIDLSGRQILLAEDNPLNQQVAKSMLEGKGASVVIAKDGIEALQALSERRYDLVLMDIQMPNMDGLEATRAIRHEMLLDDLPIIGLSANAQDDDIAMGKKYGMDDYVVKPIDATTLYTAIMKYLRD